MKKLLFTSIIALFAMCSMNAQTFKIGGSVGLPMGDASDFYSFTLGADVYYYFTDIDDLIEIGGTAGFRNFFAKDFEVAGQTIEGEDAQFLPVAAAARIKLFGLFSGGIDLGYAIGLTDGLDGGLYFRPVISFDIADTIELLASYENISDDGSIGNLNVGVLFQL
ncbi:hypothetical protein [Tamlana sp. I1]|uniref:hypothetical protein n=1 Tax=Tamlana sp. I1 TaxID=2762061 RepID=UPI00188DCF72|nr:hypothetical protein [Tamlana sp. I1]